VAWPKPTRRASFLKPRRKARSRFGSRRCAIYFGRAPEDKFDHFTHGISTDMLSRIIVRFCLLAFGGAAVVWADITLPTFWREAPIERIAQQVIEGDVFVGEDLGQGLAGMLPAVEANERADHCVAPARQAAAVIRVRLAEDAIAAVEPETLDTSLAALQRSIRVSLMCSPADPFLWFVLFWVENYVQGFSADHFRYLRMSYALGPNEGWIALKRSPFALALYDQLPPDLAEKAGNEFVRLVGSGFVREAATILTTSGWRSRAALLARLQDLPTRSRESFAAAVYDLGYDVDVPGVKRAEPRPWR
jgi:hypothetical protein